MESLNTLFNKHAIKFAQKSLDYFDGVQLEHMVELLDGDAGRRDWKEKGMRPLFRNITSSIVKKSGLLYIKKMPTMEVWEPASTQVDQRQTILFNEILESVEFDEFMINFDSVLRLLNTAIILVQYDVQSDKLVLDILHRGNCIVAWDKISGAISKIIVRVYSDDEQAYYRVYTDSEIIDYTEEHSLHSQPVQTGIQPNTFGFVPAVPFYDTHLPRTGFWVEPAKDIITFNEAYNVHLSDMEFAAAWNIHQTLFTNVNIEGSSTGIYHGNNSTDPFNRIDSASSSALLGGLGRVVHVNTMGIDNAFIEYKGPQLNLEASHKLYQDWAKAVAEDWQVTVKMDGQGDVSSGFSLIVREKDNLELRQERQRMAEAGIERLYPVIRGVWNAIHGNVFTPTSKLYVDFTDPVLPFDPKETEELWGMRIDSGRASIIDYLMEKYDMSREEAIQKHRDIQNDNSGNFVLLK